MLKGYLLSNLQTMTSRRFCDVPTVNIVVGSDKKLFQIHLTQLCKSSSFFKAAIASKVMEQSELEIILPKEDAKLFEYFTQWLYSQHYSTPSFTENGAYVFFAVRMFILAEKYDIDSLKKTILEELFVMAAGPVGAETAKPPAPDTIVYAYEHTPLSSSLRKLLADWYCYQVDESWVGDWDNQVWLRENPDIAADIIVGLVNNTTRARPRNPFETKTVKYYLEIGASTKYPECGQ